MIVMLTQDLSKGFVSWKEMYFDNKDALEALGGRLIFAGPHKDDDNKMVVLIDFDSPEAMKAFATNEELKAKRVAAGAILESNVVTVMGDESFTSRQKKICNFLEKVWTDQFGLFCLLVNFKKFS